MTSPFTQLPDEVELLEFFESEAVTACPEDGFWCYRYSDPSHGLVLQFSVNIYEKSVQTTLLIDGDAIEVVSSEEAEYVRIEDDLLRVGFLGGESGLEIRLRPSVRVRWSSLRRRQRE